MIFEIEQVQKELLLRILKILFFNYLGYYNALIFLVPLIAIVISVLFLGETITTKMVVGLILIIIGIALVNLKMKSLQKRGNMLEGDM
ncbi:EamA family transporter [Paenibacillus glucanolyticus]|uniref:EamA family transporter n=1 Tax=Paenibacillus glucanolyticus TaxID=59843 RepID=UPI0034CEC37B